MGHLTQRFISCCSAIILCRITGSYQLQQQSSPSQPNVIIVMADDMGFNDVSFHGSSQIPTPNIDQLANEGLIFSRFYAQPICTPTRSAIMTGKYPFNLGMQGGPILGGEPRGLPLDRKLLPKYLQELGYSTHLIGKWHLGQHKSSYYPNNRGFDTFLGTPGGQIDYYDYTDGQGYNLYNNSEVLRLDSKIYITDQFTTWAEEVISGTCPGRVEQKPFFLFFSPTTPHTSDYPFDSGLQTAPQYLNRPEVHNITNAQRRKYAAMVVSLDIAVGRIRQSLKENGLENNTLIWFLSDNGGSIVTGDIPNPGDVPGYSATPASNWPLRGSKGSVWEGGVRVPAVVWGAHTLINTTKRMSNQLFHLTDLLPTLVSVAGGDSKDIVDSDGIDQWEAIRSGSHSSRRTLLPLDIINNNGRRGLIWGDYKLITGTFLLNGWYRPLGTSSENPLREERLASVNCNFPEGQEQNPCSPETAACLFQIINDPCELNNIASKQPEIVQMMLDLVRDFDESYVAPINKPVDPNSLPALHGGVWVPWLDDSS